MPIVAEDWAAHLDRTDLGMFHLLSLESGELDMIHVASRRNSMSVFVVDASAIRSEMGLIGALAGAMGFPSEFGRNWDAVLDYGRSLSWCHAQGYVLMFAQAERLLGLERVFQKLVGVLEAIVSEWRDERGEFNERSRPVPFHVVFSGSPAFSQRLKAVIVEPVCTHEIGHQSVDRRPKTLLTRSGFDRAQRLFDERRSVHTMVQSFRDHGWGFRDSIHGMAALLEVPIAEARAIVSTSPIWQPVLRQEEDLFRRAAAEALASLDADEPSEEH